MGFGLFSRHRRWVRRRYATCAVTGALADVKKTM
jgi:hypothetical protein